MSGRPAQHLDRRRFLGFAGAGLAGVALASEPVAAAAAAPIRTDPFTLGVASGDPYPDGVVLWTRLAPDPLAADGFGGMPRPHRPVPVRFQVAEDEGFTRVVQDRTTIARPRLGWSVHAELRGLQPDYVYWYRFRVGDHLSPVGRTRTAPTPGAPLASLSFGWVSCQNYPNGYFTALRHLARDDLDLAFHLGDFIYEGTGTGIDGRDHLPATETFSLADYRIRYGQYRSEPELQEAQAAMPWIVVPDDHEVENNWAGDNSQPDDESDQDPAVFRQRRAMAFQAYYENQALRRSSMPDGPDMQLFRRFDYGDLARVHVLDTRQYRSVPAADGESNNEVRWDPSRTLLGDRQQDWLISGMAQTPAAWNLLAQQSKVAETDDTVGAGESYPADNWDGYAASRTELFDALVERDVDNMVILSGDAHVNMASDLKPRFKQDDSPVIGAEFLGTSVSSGRDGSDISQRGLDRMAENPHIKLYNQRRGYQRCVATPEELRVDYRVLPSVSAPGAPVFTRATAYVEAGRPGIAQLEDKTIV